MSASLRRIGEVVVTCPSCGASLTVPVKVKAVWQNPVHLTVEFATAFAQHKECEGRR